MTPPPATCTYDDDFLPRTAADELLQQCASLSFLQDRKGMTCKSVQHVDKAIYFLGNADPPRRAHYYWGQDLAEVTRGEPMPRFLLELRAKVRISFCRSGSEGMATLWYCREVQRVVAIG